MPLTISGDGGVTGLNTVTSNVVEFSGNVSVAGTVTYEDVTNVDSVGIVTARSGVRINTGGIVVTTGVSTFTTGPVLIGSGTSTGTVSQSLQVTGGTYISGSVGIGTINPTNTLNLGGLAGVGQRWHNFTSGNSAYITLESGDRFQYNVGGSGVHSWYTGGAEKVRIDSGGQVYIGQYANAYDNPGRFNISNGSRVSTTSGAYVPSNGGFVDYARYELISKCVTSFPANNNKIMARNGAPLTINNTRDAWSHYNNLPNYLIGTLTNDNINDSSFTFTLACTMTVFLLRDNGWNSVDLSGWALIESGTVQGINAIANGRLYVKTLAAGTHALSNNSAMYFWLI